MRHANVAKCDRSRNATSSTSSLIPLNSFIHSFALTHSSCSSRASHLCMHSRFIVHLHTLSSLRSRFFVLIVASRRVASRRVASPPIASPPPRPRRPRHRTSSNTRFMSSYALPAATPQAKAKTATRARGPRNNANAATAPTNAPRDVFLNPMSIARSIATSYDVDGECSTCGIARRDGDERGEM